MGVTRNNRAGRNDFKSLSQKEGETLREFARRVRSMGVLVFAHLDLDERDEHLRDQFLDGLKDPQLSETLLREETRSFAQTIERAAEIESISVSMQNRKNMRTAIVRVAQEVPTSSLQKHNGLREQLNDLTDATTELTRVMTKFVGAYRQYAPDGGGPSNFLSTESQPSKLSKCGSCGSYGHIAHDCQVGQKSLNLRRPGHF